MDATTDRFGLGWRPELALPLLNQRDRIDVIEVIGDEWLGASSAKLAALRALAREIPMDLHLVSLGLASTERTDERRLAQLAHLVERVEPESWSEHLAFVRGGGIEIGHLTAPPRRCATIEGFARNFERARAVVGRPPRLENIASLVDAPASEMSESEWIAGCAAASGCELLLDLHNLHANATNFGWDPIEWLDSIPFERVAKVHVAGGRWIRRGRTQALLDDHLHEVPEAVYALLEAVGARAPRAVTVVLERDGRFPPFADLLAELERARESLARGRARRSATVERRTIAPMRTRELPSDADARLEAFLARLFVRTDARNEFLADRARAARRADLPDSLIERLAAVNADELELAAESCARKRSAGPGESRDGLRSLLRRLVGQTAP